ncbi:MAG: hypothetical protein ACJ8CR_23850 [Roseiflexaceae bacterium]|jgi:ElaB/YqjD/DUF883 family membrane-anchored ribosome-binding protein
MTERQKNTTTTLNQQPEKPLSTADMAVAAEQQRQPEVNELKHMQEDAVPVVDTAAPAQTGEQPIQLLATEELQTLRSRWDSIQTGFVDEPRRAVEQADSLVADMMQRLAQLFADERSKLESQWSRGDNVSTEDLRVALQRYRSFFDRLLSI